MHYQPQKNLLQNRIILVTGASDGIGREAALTYSEYGASLILLGRNEEKLKAVAREIENAGGTPTPWYTLDLLTCTPASCQALAQRISTHYPRLDGVLHNAGLLGEVRPMDEQDPEIWQQVMQVNVNGTFFLTQAYAVSKFATEGMMQVLAEEYQSRHLRVNCINPGGTRTKMRASAFPTEDPQKLKTPADIMPLYLWLMGDDSRRKTGMTFDAQPGRKPGISQ